MFLYDTYSPQTLANLANYSGFSQVVPAVQRRAAIQAVILGFGY